MFSLEIETMTSDCKAWVEVNVYDCKDGGGGEQRMSMLHVDGSVRPMKFKDKASAFKFICTMQNSDPYDWTRYPCFAESMPLRVTSADPGREFFYECDSSYGDSLKMIDGTGWALWFVPEVIVGGPAGSMGEVGRVVSAASRFATPCLLAKWGAKKK